MNDNVFFCILQQLRGNEGNDETKYVKLGNIIRARHVRVRPNSYYKQMCMRIELYGCLSSGEFMEIASSGYKHIFIMSLYKIYSIIILIIKQCLGLFCLLRRLLDRDSTLSNFVYMADPISQDIRLSSIVCF